MADRVDTVVDAMQPTCGSALPDRARVHAQRDELARGDHAVLPAGERRYPPIERGCVEFRNSSFAFSTHPGHAPMMARKVLPVGPRIATHLRKIGHGLVSTAAYPIAAPCASSPPSTA